MNKVDNMSETAHTPGPWRVAPSSAYSEAGLHIDAGVNGTDGFICLAGMPDDPEAVANARLIAAAPDMLKALRAVVAVADRKTDEFDLARAAIAKAEG